MFLVAPPQFFYSARVLQRKGVFTWLQAAAYLFGRQSGLHKDGLVLYFQTNVLRGGYSQDLFLREQV